MLDTVCVFSAAGTLFAAPVSLVWQIVDLPSMATSSGAPAGVEGAVNVRGALACVFDVARALGLGSCVGETGIVFRCDSRVVVVRADEALDVVRVDTRSLLPLPSGAPKSLRSSSFGLLETPSGWACVLDLPRAVPA